MIPATPELAKPTRVTSSAIVSSVAGRLMAVTLEGGTTASSVDFTDDTDGSGTAFWACTAPFTDNDASAASTIHVSFLEMGGIPFETGLYATLAGTGAVAYVWFQVRGGTR